jgi:hypothetical protein
VTIRSVETLYQGYRFRSRLEARWAVFFDALGLKWEYEPQGYDFGAIGCYLPDFYLPELGGGTWIEVKPDGADSTHPDEPKWRALAEATGKDLLLAAGVPDAREYEALSKDSLLGGWLTACFQQKYLPPINHDGAPRLYWCPGGDEDCDANEAIEAARSSRFEHGENGISPQHALMTRLRIMDSANLAQDPSELKRRIMTARGWGSMSREEATNWCARAGLKNA